MLPPSVVICRRWRSDTSWIGKSTTTRMPGDAEEGVGDGGAGVARRRREDEQLLAALAHQAAEGAAHEARGEVLERRRRPPVEAHHVPAAVHALQRHVEVVGVLADLVAARRGEKTPSA